MLNVMHVESLDILLIIIGQEIIIIPDMSKQFKRTMLYVMHETKWVILLSIAEARIN